jgi:two-component system response regulator
LLVEDSAEDERLSLRAITSSGVPCEVIVIRHGGEVLDAVLSANDSIPDLIVLDFHLPGFNGLEILRKLRSEEKTRYVPIVMLSSLELESEVLDCLGEGANSCVRKPLDPRVYVEQVALIVRYWLTVDRRPENSH